MIYDICMYGDPVLRKEAAPIDKVDDEIRELAKDMLATMHEARGVGLAAQQIGLTRAICVVFVPPEYDVDEEGNRLNPEVPMPLVLLNPVVAEPSEKTTKRDEGCLSFPDITAPINRADEVTVSYMDLEGKEQSLRVRDFIARAVQHEVDHLNGVLFIDRMSPVKKIAIKGQLKRMRKATEEQMGLA